MVFALHETMQTNQSFVLASQGRALFSRALLTSVAIVLRSVFNPRLAADTGFASSITDYFDHWHDRVEAAQASQ